jgi:hypothetical protein
MPVVYPLSVVVVMTWSTVAFGACVPLKHRDCIDLSAVPDIAQQVIAPEKVAPPPEKAPPTPPTSTYNGPTVGMSNAVRRAPEIGYHWSID